ncbi:RagB/SusD family nutrient uptake outer membrane protein [Fulvivirga sp. M361]|uniref:RagB/SusD family nutrient uptake outer membrane protein n=1 Tax=Fulvivirga sp. M361 TaxID=2594266 RepID=UPI00162AC3D6|nr:RagB/SusD family nutrient uptake outer membrane protein [Fulvivirga sp. M361]
MKNILLIILSSCLFLVSGCGDDFLEVTDENSLVTVSVFENYGTSVEAINAAYTPLKEVDLYGDQIHFFFHQITHEYDLLFQGDDGWNQMKTFALTPINQTLDAAWNGLGKIILRSNSVIEGLEGLETSGDFTEEQKNELVGQAYFLRGFAFFLGVRMFGEQPVSVDGSVRGFPLITSVPSNREATLVSRASVDSVYQQIILDFEVAETLLPESWTGNDLGRATKGAASAYLGKVYLYQEEWPKAIEYFEKIINNASYRLLDNFADNFNGEAENGSESIFELQFSKESPLGAFNGGPGHVYATRHAPSDLEGFGNVSVPLSSFDRLKDDPRVGATLIRPGDFIPFIDAVYVGTGAEDYRPRKFVDINSSQQNTTFGQTFNGFINMPIMRLADVYLMYAEAQNENGGTTVALEYVNKVRRRAYGEPIDVPSVIADIAVAGGAPLLTAIQEERYIELFGECHRWFDLLRWELADDVLGSRGFITGTHEAMPIPIDEIQLNTVIRQNDGY